MLFSRVLVCGRQPYQYSYLRHFLNAPSINTNLTQFQLQNQINFIKNYVTIDSKKPETLKVPPIDELTNLFY